MRTAYAPYQHLWEYLDDDTQIIAVNSRLTEHLNKLFIYHLKTKTNRSVVNQRILTLYQFFDQMIDCLYFNQKTDEIPPFFYNSNQNLLLWQQIIENDKNTQKDDVFLNVFDATKDAITAYDLCCNWITDMDIFSYPSEHLDFKRFKQWLIQFQAYCNDHHIYPETFKLAMIIKKLKNLQLPFKRLIFIGFNDYSLALKKLLEQLKELSIELIHWQLESPNDFSDPNTPFLISTPKLPQATTSIYAFEQTENELIAITKMIYENFYRYPNQTIGLIIPDLHLIRHRIEKIFDVQFFSKHNRLEALNNTDKPYMISGGKPLATMPIIKTALMILKLNASSNLEHLIRVLESPFTYSVNSSFDQRQQLIDLIKHKYFKSTTIKTLLSDPDLVEHLSEFKLPLEKIINQSVNYASKPLLSIQTKLQLFNFPGNESLSSENYQAVEQFYQLLTELKKLHNIVNQSDSINTIIQLEQLAKQTIFQAQSNPNASIFVLGILEASGHYFDRLYVMRMHNRLWPSQPKPNTLLPIELQKQYQMPHATYERQLYYAMQISRAFFYQCHKLFISYSLFDGEITQSLTPIMHTLIPNINLIKQSDDFKKHQLLPEVKFKETTLSLEALQEPYNANSYLYKDFSHCPFKAQMKYRLKLEPLIEFKEPLNAKDKGILIHQMMEIIWRQLKTQQALNNLTDTELEHIIQQAIKQALYKNKQLFPSQLDYLAMIETNRITLLIKQWLYLEKQREIPFHVLSHEKSTQKQVGLLTTKLRIDRIDQLDDGNLWLIDYKSAYMTNPKGWYNDTLSEPQLPLYAIALDNVTGISFAQINGQSMKLSTLSTYHSSLQLCETRIDIKTQFIEHRYKTITMEYDNWQQLIHYWNEHLTELSNEFTQGKLDITPNTQCTFCEFDQLCHYQHFKRGTI
ncbi:MAG: hypothetical protein EP298_07485 [Gammaproteobacteria bacterium]|nr:MAG: hypothetical protein EP298_07485 [Gammaproteobacteria bacterium]UTW42651.1 PD-(D/E)XK nuclease family protein [bacterium SCSIO 12844]